MNLGWTEILLIGGIALLLFGPSKLPGLGRSLGESIRGFKKALEEDPVDEKPAQTQISENKKPSMSESAVMEDEKEKTEKS